MSVLSLPFTARFVALTLCILFSLLMGVFYALHPEAGAFVVVPLLLFAGLTLVGLYDLVQTRHAVLRNYPILAHLRFLLEDVRPELRQYFFEGDMDGTPFPRDMRAVVYQRAKKQLDKRPFGTQDDVYREQFEWMHHSLAPQPVAKEGFRVRVGGPDCRQSYDASLLNISAMSYGSLSANAILALNKGARLGGFAHDTGEGSVSPYHREGGGDLVWEIGSGYFGCRDRDGKFSPENFAATATLPQIKMIEIKLSQGAKPGHGGVLPGAKVTAEIAAIRSVAEGRDCISPAAHSAFSTPVAMMEFIKQLRELSGGKPVGFKLCVGHPWEFLGILKAMIETGIKPDFIVVDGKEGGTGAAPLEFMNHLGMPMRDGLSFVHSALTGANLRDGIRLAVSGKITTGFDMARAIALGADWCNAARAFMFSVGCIQSQRCHTGECPTGVATQDPTRQRAINIDDKAMRTANFHRETLHALAELIAAAGLSHPNELRPEHFMRRVSAERVVTFAEQYPCLQPGELLAGGGSPAMAAAWARARSDRFGI